MNERLNLRSGFTLGDWIVYPLAGKLVGKDGEQSLRPKSMQVLLYLAENAGAVVEREELLRQIWGERAQSDEPLTVSVSELRRALGDTRAEPDYIDTIPKRGYRLLKPVAAVTRESAEVEPSGSVTLTEPQDTSKTIMVRKIGIAVVVLLAAGLFAAIIERVLDEFDVNLLSRTPSNAELIASQQKSIVVLPLINISPDEEQEYFSDGISEELMILLAKLPELRVISRTSAFSYKGKDLDIPTIAEQLNVAHVLEGSVRKSGNQVRIVAQLIEARSDTQLWSKTYDRTLDDIFAIQDEIAASVVNQLKITLLGNAPTVLASDPEAYALLLRARYLSRQYTPDAFEKSIALYEQALAIDPDFALAWAELAADYVNQAGQGLRPLDEGYALARAAANRALLLDPASALAHRTLAWMARSYDRDLVTAAKHYEQALAVNPADTRSISGAATMAASLGRLDLAIELAEFAVARDPLSAVGYRQLGFYYRDAGRLDQAITAFETTLTLSPGQIGGQYFIGAALLLKGEPEQALAAMAKEAFEGWRLIGLALAHDALGQTTAADAALTTLIEKYERDAAYNIASVLAFRGEADKAFEWLTKATAYKDPGLVDIASDPLFAKLRVDPRWLPFLESVGKSPEQLSAIEFNVSLPE